MEFHKVRVLQYSVKNGTKYEYYGVLLPSQLGPLWSGADVRIEDQGNSLLIKRIDKIKREETA